MKTASFFLKMAGDESTAREVVATAGLGSLEGFIAALDQADARSDGEPTEAEKVANYYFNKARLQEAYENRRTEREGEGRTE